MFLTLALTHEPDHTIAQCHGRCLLVYCGSSCEDRVLVCPLMAESLAQRTVPGEQ